MNADNKTIWSFDIGKASIGEAVRQGMKFSHVESLILPEEFAETKTAAGRRRFFRTRQAHRAREAWLRKVFKELGLEVLSGRVAKPHPSQKKQWIEQPADSRLEQEFPGKEEGEICYTSCLLRIKLLRGDKLEPWQLYKAFHSAIQRRGYDPDIAWKTKEQKRSLANAKPDDDEGVTLNRMNDFTRELEAMAPGNPEFQLPCYFDAREMGLWSPENPHHLILRIDHSAKTTRNQIVPRSLIEKEIRLMVEKAALQYPVLKGKADYLLYGPSGQAYASYYPELRKKHNLHEGSVSDWQGVLTQKIPRFDNRIIAKCALIPRLNVCKIRPPGENQNEDEKRTGFHRSAIIVAEVTYLMKLKNLRFWRGEKEEKATSQATLPGMFQSSRGRPIEDKLTPAELKALFEDTTFTGYKITATQWKKYCTKILGGFPTTGAEEVAPPRSSGRSSYCRPALEMIKRLLLSGLTPSQAHAAELARLNGNTKPHQGLIPQDLHFLTCMGDSWEKLYLPNQKLEAIANLSTDRVTAIRSLIGSQNDPIVRHRLNLFYSRILHLEEKFGEPDHVVIEFIREDFMGDKAKFELRKFQRERAKERIKAREDAKNAGHESRGAGLRLELLQQQGGICVYTGEALVVTKLDEYEIEHIVPREMGGPDSALNYVLTTHKTNQAKGKQTPYQWLSGTTGWDSYCTRVEKCFGIRSKKKAKLLTAPDAHELAEKYTSLAETAWITKLSQTLLSIHFDWKNGIADGERKVTVVNGSLTARIRRINKLNSILHPDAANEEEAEKKNRDDDRHHALDAMCINFVPDWTKNPGQRDYGFFRFPDEIYGTGGPLKYFKDYIDKVTPEKVCVEKPSLGESIYGLRRAEPIAPTKAKGKKAKTPDDPADLESRGIMVKRFPLKDLAYKTVMMKKVFNPEFARKGIENLRDSRIQSLVREFLETNPLEPAWNDFCREFSLTKPGKKQHRVQRVSLNQGSADEFRDLAKSGTKGGQFKKGAKGHKGQILYRDSQGNPKVRPIYVFESNQKVINELKASSASVEIIDIFRSGDRIQITKDAGMPQKPIPKGVYTLKTIIYTGQTQLRSLTHRKLPALSVGKLLEAGFCKYTGS